MDKCEGKIEELSALIIQVDADWSVRIRDHYEPKNDGVSVIEKVSDNLHGRGPGYMATNDRRTTYNIWPREGDDFEVHGMTLRIYNPVQASISGVRTLTQEFTYYPPSN